MGLLITKTLGLHLLSKKSTHRMGRSTFSYNEIVFAVDGYDLIS